MMWGLFYVFAGGNALGAVLNTAGSSAVAAGYGVNLKTMFVLGFWAALLCLFVIVAVSFLSIRFWPGFTVA
jgi:hypothetical protein